IEAIKPLITKAMTDRPEAGGMPGKAVPQAISLDVAQSSASEQCSGQLIPDTALSFSSATAGASPSLN
ncbi:hypothetical protein, partial [Paraburkholderia sp. Ac-20342]|uniref:hypothetical protein n=1 Tax=Paraburkholderia sp. Ac-20342 TaxID=2703889 RepID=UPI001981A82C